MEGVGSVGYLEAQNRDKCTPKIMISTLSFESKEVEELREDKHQWK
jgi:hypothetical protein